MESIFLRINDAAVAIGEYCIAVRGRRPLHIVGPKCGNAKREIVELLGRINRGDRDPRCQSWLRAVNDSLCKPRDHIVSATGWNFISEADFRTFLKGVLKTLPVAPARALVELEQAALNLSMVCLALETEAQEDKEQADSLTHPGF